MAGRTVVFIGIGPHVQERHKQMFERFTRTDWGGTSAYMMRMPKSMLRDPERLYVKTEELRFGKHVCHPCSLVDHEVVVVYPLDEDTLAIVEEEEKRLDLLANVEAAEREERLRLLAAMPRNAGALAGDDRS